ncbi:MAG: hypothetical protein ACKPGP_04250, partial [Dolichospermum sp.]
IFDDVSNLAKNIKPYLPPKNLVSMRLLMTSRKTPDKNIAKLLYLQFLDIRKRQLGNDHLHTRNTTLG